MRRQAGGSDAAAARTGVRRRNVAIGAAAAGLAIAVAAVGYALASDRPADEMMSTASTPTAAITPATPPTSSAPVLPVADPDLPFGACGSLVGAVPDPPRDDRLVLDISASSYQAHQGEPVQVSAQPRVAARGVAAGFYPSTGPVFIVTHDDVTVATAALYPSAYAGDLTAFTAADPRQTLTTFSAHLRLTACGSDTTPVGTDLPPGHYELRAAIESYLYRSEPAGMDGLRTGERTAEQVLAADAADHVTVVSGALPLEILAGAAPTGAAVPVPTTLPELPAASPVDDCSPGPPPLSDAAGILPVAAPSEPQVVSLATPSSVDVVVTYRGPGRLRLAPLGAALILAQDNAVVAQAGGYTEGAGAVDLDYGTTVRQRVSLSQVQLCDGGSGSGGVLAPGTYQAYPTAALGLDRFVLADGSVVAPGAAGGDHLLVGDPFTLTVTP